MTNTPRSRLIQEGLRTLRIYLALCVLGAAVVAALMALSARTRPLFSSVDPMASPPYAAIGDVGTSGIWCLVSESARARAAAEARFDRLEPGRWWFNLIAPELGAPAMVDVDQKIWPVPAGITTVVVTAAAVTAAEPHVQALEAFVRAGGLLVVERPRGALLELSGASLRSDGPTRLNALWNTPLREPVDLDAVQLEPDARPLLAGDPLKVGGLPVSWGRPLGAGAVVGVAFDAAALLVRLMQGHPRPDFTFAPAPRHNQLSDIAIPSDMVESGPRFDAPEIDAFVRQLWAEASALRPMPGWWDMPEGAPAAYLVTHDEEGFGDRGVFMAEEEARRGVRSTWFVLTRALTPGGATVLRELGAEVALHWHRGFGGGNLEALQLGPFSLKLRALTLARQQQMVAGLLSGEAPPPITRIHGLQWDPDFDSTFRRLIAAGIRLDSSYGPVGNQTPWRFGTVRPFRPLDREGRLLPITELPFVLQDDEAPPLATLRRVIDQGALEHLTIVPIFHVNTMAYNPSEEPIDAWLEGFDRARARGMWLGTVERLRQFLDGREASSIRANSPGVWQVDAKADGQWLRVPARNARGERLEALEIDSRPPSTTRCIEVGGQPVVLVPVMPGGHRVTMGYSEGDRGKTGVGCGAQSPSWN